MKLSEIAKKTQKKASSVMTAGFLIFLCIVGYLTVAMNHASLFDFDGDTLWGKFILEKEQIQEAFGDNILGFDRFLSVYGMTQNMMGTTVYEDAGYTYLLKDTNGYLHYYTRRQDENPYADRIAAFADALEEGGIPFLYLQAPTKQIEGFTVMPAGITSHTKDNSDAMRNALRTRGIDVLSFQEVFDSNGVDPASIFYKTDHHWTTQAAFHAFSAALPYLNEKMGWSLDTTLGSPENWRSEAFDAYFLGSIGRRVGRELAGLDDYTFYEPTFETALDVYYPKISEIWPNWSGNFREALVREAVLYGDDVTSNRYASYFQYDYGELIIKNKLRENGPRIAIVKDSFALPFSAFLSTAVGEIDMIDLREFEGSVTAHLLETKPDLVIVLYSNGSFTDTMYQFDK